MRVFTQPGTEKDLDDELARASAAGCEIVFIDTPPGRSGEALAAAEAADLVLIPFWSDMDSFEEVTRTALVAKRLGKQAYGVLNFATPNSRTHEDTSREVLRAISLPLVPVVLHRYEVHKLANLRGQTAQEIDPGARQPLRLRAPADCDH